MANVVGGYGFAPVGSLDGGAYNGSTVRVFFAGTTVTTGLFTGDLVKYDGTGTVDGYPEVVLSSATDPSWGVIVGTEAKASDLSQNGYIAGGTSGYARLAPVEGNLFKVRLNDDAASLGVGIIGSTTIMVINAGSTVTGYSGITASTTDAGTQATDELRILGIVDRPDNDPALETSEVIIQFNDSQVKLGAVGV